MTKILGVDEARRGPVIGDMVICGALIEEIYEEDLKKLGVKDSKLLTPKQRERLFPKILEKIEKHKIIVIPPQEIDSMLNSQEFNLNRLEAIKTAMIINELKPDKAIVDCPSPNKEEYRNYLNIFLKHKPELILEHKAERYPIVAAASILAKVTGDRRLEDLKNSLGIEFGSLPYNEEILIKNKNKIEYKKIGDLVENGYHNIEVFSLDPKSLMIKPFKVTRFIDHPKTNIFNITLERGKNINLTENHPIFVLDNQLNIVPKQIKDLKKGEFICLAGSIPHRGNLNKINLYNYLINLSEKKSPILVYGNPVKEIFKKFGTKKIQDIYKKLNYSRTTVYSWKSNNIIPLHLIKEIIKGKRFNLDDGYLRSIKRDNIKLPINFKLNKEFLWFLGMYVAEGSLGKDKVIISSKDEKTFFRIKRLAKKYKINVYKEKCNIGLSSIVLTKLIKGMNLGRYAREKQIPNFLFSCKKDFIKAFLDGLYEGD